MKSTHQTKQGRWVVPVVVLVVAAAGAGGWWALKGRAPSTKPVPATAGVKAGLLSASPPGADATSALPRRVWKVGQTLVYDIEVGRAVGLLGGTTAIASGPKITSVPGAPALPPTPGLAPIHASHLTGSLALTVAVDDGADVLLRGELRGARFDLQPSSGTSLAASFATPFFVRMKKDGTLGEFSHARGVSTDVNGALEALVTSIDLVAPYPTPATWKAEGRDLTGEYEAEYAVDGRVVHRTKERYLRAQGTTGYVDLPAHSHYGVKSEAEFVIDAAGWPDKATESESLDVTTAAMRVLSESRTAATLTSTEDHPEWAGATPGADYVSGAKSNAEAFARARVNADENLVAGASFDQLRADLARGGDNAHRGHLQGQLTAYLRLHPEAAKDAKEAILHGKLDGNSVHRMEAALSGSGTPEGQAALASLMTDPEASASTRVTSLASLGLAKKPTAATEQAVEAQLGSSDPQTSTNAALALGNVVHSMENGAGGDPGDAVDQLIAKLQSASTDAERETCLDALGNTGDPRALAAIEAFLPSPSVPVRAAAAFGMRFMAPGEADRVVVAASADPAAQVRIGAVKTLPFRPIGLVLPAMISLLKTDPEKNVRITIVNGFNIHLHDDPSIPEALAWTAQHDSSQAVRQLAAQIIGPPRHTE